MDASVRVPNLGGRIITPIITKTNKEKEDSPCWIKMFGHEITLICMFVLILMLMYYLSTQSSTTSISALRRQTRMKKAFTQKINEENINITSNDGYDENYDGSSDQDE